MTERILNLIDLGYDIEDATEIANQEANELIKEFKNHFKQNKYEMYNSGGKGIHLELPLDKIYEGVNVPKQQKQYLQKLTNKADTSIYKHSGLIRLANTKHERTGNRKTLIYKQEGELLSLPEFTSPVFNKYVKQEDISLEDTLFINICALLNNEPFTGNRHMSLFKLVKDIQAVGFSGEYAYETIMKINETWSNQKDNSDLERLIKDVYDEK